MGAAPDFPAMADVVGRTEPVPRRLRGFVGGRLVFDTVRALYAWDSVKYPTYLIPFDDVVGGALADEDRTQRLRRGSVRVHGLRAGETSMASVARVFDRDAGPVAGYVRFDWASLDWFEEDEQVFVHPRNPYTRVDALRSSRHVRVELDGHVLAETSSPVLLFETGLPTRYYLDRTDVDFSILASTETVTTCPYKGQTTDYWDAETAGGTVRDVAWSYRQPHGAVAAIAGLVCFYNDLVELVVDGVALEKVEDVTRRSAL